MILRAIAQTRRLAFAPATHSAARAAARLERNFERFVRSLTAHGYALAALDGIVGAPERGRAYLRHEVHPNDRALALKLAAVHQKLQVPGTFHLVWDLMEGIGRHQGAARRFRQFDPRYVRLGLQCDPLSRWLARTRFAGNDREWERFVRSANFAGYLDEMLRAWQNEGADAAALRSLHDGAWQCLGQLDRSFRGAAGRSSSISGRGSPLSNAFERACAARPELAALAGWFSPIDFLVKGELERFGYRFEATRFPPGGGPGPVVVFGGAAIEELRDQLDIRIGGGGGLVAILPVENWTGDRYADLLPLPGSAAARVAPTGPVGGPIPSEPVFTRERHLAGLGWRCERFDKRQLAEASRSIVGGAIDLSFTRFVDWLRSEGYVFDGFENGSLQFRERRAYLRYDVHIQDLLAAYVLADLHEQLAIAGSFQIMWKFSRYEEGLEPYFTKLLEFDRRYVQFGLHAAPGATWYLSEKLGGDYSRQVEAMASPDFTAWLLDLHAAYCRDGDDAPELRKVRQGTDDTLASIAASFRATFGDWKSISAHGNFLTNGFLEVCGRHPEVNALRPYFHPVDYFGKWGVERFGFDYEITWLGFDDFDEVLLPRVLMEGSPEETRREWYRGRVAHGGGFVALLHPATWTCSQNATFFLPEEAARDGVTEPKGAGDRIADRPA